MESDPNDDQTRLEIYLTDTPLAGTSRFPVLKEFGRKLDYVLPPGPMSLIGSHREINQSKDGRLRVSDEMEEMLRQEFQNLETPPLHRSSRPRSRGIVLRSFGQQTDSKPRGEEIDPHISESAVLSSYSAIGYPLPPNIFDPETIQVQHTPLDLSGGEQEYQARNLCLEAPTPARGSSGTNDFNKK